MDAPDELRSERGRVMFIKSVRLKKPQLWMLGAALVLAVLIFFAVKLNSGRKGESFIMRTEEERQSFIASMGWETEPEYTECRSVTIPEEFGDVYEQYNDLQKQQGFDLTKYKGRTAEVYTYPVLNYEGHTEKDCMKLTLIVYNGELIGGDVCCTELGGFMQGLKRGE